MSEWYDRLKEVREKHGFNQGDFGRKIDKDASAISRYEIGKVKGLSKTLIKELSKVLPPEDVEYIAGEIMFDSVDSGCESILEYEKVDMIKAGIVDTTASAGSSNHVEGIDVFTSGRTLSIDPTFFKTMPTAPLHAIQVDGYSMVPMLLPDSWVIFRDTNVYEGDGLYVLNFRNVLMVKLISVDPMTGHLKIKSINPDYESWEYDPENDQSVLRIFGKVLRCVI